MTEVKLIRMSSGEDVLATILERDDDSITIQDAIVAVPTNKSISKVYCLHC